MREQFPGPEIQPDAKNTPERPLRERVNFVHAEAAIKIIGEHAEKEGIQVNPEIIKDIFYSFLEEDINNTRIFESQKFPGVSFPTTVINTRKFAETLYAKYANQGPRAAPEEPEGIKPAGQRKEFIFGSFVTPVSGSVFTFYEEALHRLVMKLPTALEALEKGGHPESTDVYLLGSPTNLLGTLSPEFADGLSDENTFDRFGDLYAEFVESELGAPGEERTDDLYLYGISMGGSFAAKTAEKILEDKRATQVSDVSADTALPRLRVRADVPVGFIESKKRMLQIPVGFFAIEGVYKLATDSYTRAAGPGEGKFVREVNTVLAERGISEHMSGEQEKFKKKVLRNIGFNLIKGTPISQNLKLDMVRATYDPLVYSREFVREASQHKEAQAGSLGQNLVPHEDNIRTTAIDQTHSMVFFRENESRRIIKAAGALEKLKSSQQERPEN